MSTRRGYSAVRPPFPKHRSKLSKLSNVLNSSPYDRTGGVLDYHIEDGYEWEDRKGNFSGSRTCDLRGKKEQRKVRGWERRERVHGAWMGEWDVRKTMRGIQRDDRYEEKRREEERGRQEYESAVYLMDCAKNFLELLNKFKEKNPGKIDTTEVNKKIIEIVSKAHNIEKLSSTYQTSTSKNI
ncbi:unnamed protein product [Moneuplotes crassus]|uniref:Uncharacterized protein n=1 Tax=Euplotes crassus TaxID=5936 RepID=A0AAD1UBC8_EUPCR|nr:unnamed protein product [Moneuplotes crassus]